MTIAKYLKLMLIIVQPLRERYATHIYRQLRK
jgi:hypothetical protein